MSKSGKKQTEIAKELGVCQATISYWLGGEELRKRRSMKACQSFKSKSKPERSVVYRRRRRYLRDYHRKRYNTDEAFRIKQIRRVSEYQRKKNGDRRRSKEIGNTTQGIEV